MNTVYISRKKQFTKFDWRQIFQGENKCDNIQFLIERGLCEECLLAVEKCVFNKLINSITGTIFWNVLSNFCEAVGIKPEVGLNFGYLLPYDKENN